MKQIKIWICIWSLVLLVEGSLAQAQNKKVVVGAKTFTEQFILAKMLTLLYQKAGYQVEEKNNITTRVLRQQLLDGEVDIYWEYTGTAYKALLQQDNPAIAANAEKVYEAVRELDRENGVMWLKRSPVNNTFVLVIKRSRFKELNMETLSDLATQLNQGKKLRFGLYETFYYRPDGMKKLAEFYQFKPPSIDQVQISANKAYLALDNEKIEVGLTYATAAEIKSHDLKILKDDKEFFPVYNPAPTLLAKSVQRDPQLAALVRDLGPMISAEEMVTLNHDVDVNGKNVETVAREWLTRKGLLP